MSMDAQRFKMRLGLEGALTIMRRYCGLLGSINFPGKQFELFRSSETKQAKNKWNRVFLKLFTILNFTFTFHNSQYFTTRIGSSHNCSFDINKSNIIH